MKRLVICLYLLLSLSLLGAACTLVWTLTSALVPLWQHESKHESSDPAALLALAQLLSQLPAQQRASALANITEDPHFPLTLVNSEQLTRVNKQQLSANAVLTVTTTDGQRQYYVAVGEQVLMAGPVKLTPKLNVNDLIFGCFFIVIALVASIGLWPLLRDLKQLKLACQQLEHKQWQTRLSLSARSPLYEIASRLNNMRDHVSQFIDQQSHLLNTVAHEIRTPLSRLKFAMALLVKPAHSDENSDPKPLFASMNDDLNEIDQLLAEFLGYASLDPKLQVTHFKACDLNALIEKIVKRLQSQHKIKLQFTPTDSPLITLLDPNLMDRALQNLIRNAQRFAKQSIQIKVSQDLNFIQVSVTDDGEGIPLTEQSQIFLPFYRSERDRNDDQGHGLGLAIVKRIMDSHGGTVSLKSQPGNTQFTLRWPRH